MPFPNHLQNTPAGNDILGLGLSCVRVDNPMLLLRAAQWRNSLAKVGLNVPFWLVHDLGLLASTDPTQVPLGHRYALPANLQPAGSAYLELLKELSTSQVMERARAWQLNDDLVTVFLLRILSPVYERFIGLGRRKVAPTLPLDPEVYRDLEPQLVQAQYIGPDDEAFLARIAKDHLRVLIAVEQIDLDTLRLVGMFGSVQGGAMGLVDLLSVFETPEANDVVNFSLDLLPSVLETKRASGQQTFSVDGFSGMTRRGNLDSLVLSELAYDDELFDMRFSENEVFYYAHEKQSEEDRRLHYILIDASASMRGQRSVFARGLAVTLVKKLTLKGEDVFIRFFDSQLYDEMRARAGAGQGTGRHGGAISIPQILCFKGERGRNYAKVFSVLAGELKRLEKRERRTPIVYMITHAECHIPVSTVESLRSTARLYGIFMLPSSGALDLAYLDQLHTVQIVEEEALYKKEERAKRALSIVEDVAEDVAEGVTDDGADETPDILSPDGWADAHGLQ